MSSKITLILIFGIFSIVIILPLLIDPSPLKQSDLNGNILQLVYLKKSLYEYFSFPLWNPYINQGLPFVHDPLNTYLYPVTLFSYLIFNPETATKATYLISIFLSIITMYLLTRYFKVPIIISAIVALTYASSGFLVSRITAGHLEKILTYPLLPLFILYLFKLYEKPSIFKSGIIAIFVSLMLFAGDIYTTTYSLFILLGLFIFNFFKDIKNNFYIILIFILFTLFSSIKLLPLLELQGLLAKTVDPYAGSVNIVGFIYYLFIPIKPIFNFLGIKELITSDFGWWEKIAFIGPVPLIAALYFTFKYKVFKINNKFIMPIGVFILILISTPAVNLNPYNFLIKTIPNLSDFHVPSRTFAYFGAFLLLIMALTASRFYMTKYKNIVIIFITFNLIATVFFFYAVINSKQFIEVADKQENLLNIISKDKKSIYYVAYRNLSNPQQYKYIENEIKLLGPNYGFQLKDSPAKKFTRFDYENVAYKDIIPKYFLAKSKSKLPSSFEADYISTSDTLQLFEIENYTPYSSVSGGIIESVKILPNKISVNVESTTAGILIIHESSFPGWMVYREGTKISLLENKFLSTKTAIGNYKYHFIFTSKTFYVGLMISVISIISWLLLIIYQNKQHCRKFLHKFLRFF